MTAYIKTKNPDVTQSVVDMIPLYLSEGKAEGVRGDIAFAQSCLETGNFGFSGSAVTLDQNNFCGMGVTSNGMKGSSGLIEKPQGKPTLVPMSDKRPAMKNIAINDFKEDN